MGNDSKGLERPIIKEDKDEIPKDDPALPITQVTEYRGLAARANYLSLDRFDIQYAAKEACRDMSTPRISSMSKMKRLARYLLEHPRQVLVFRPCEVVDSPIVVYTDSDWAGCLRTRKSTSGGMLFFEGGLLKTWSSTQASVAQSSGEAEYYALVRACSEALGMQSVMRDLGWEAKIVVHIDSSAAKSVASRTGLGKLRHIEVKFLRAQEFVRFLHNIGR